MKITRDLLDILDLKHRKSLRWGLLALSTLFIISASALVYASMIYERALRVGGTTGVNTGLGSTASAEVSFTPTAVMLLAVAGLVIGLSMFGFLREAAKHISKAPGGLGSSPTGPVSMSSAEEEEWEESPAKDEDEESGQDNS